MIRYSFDFTLDKSSVNESGMIKEGHMLRLFQKAACEHAESAGLGFDDLIKENLIWVVTKIRYRVELSLYADKKYTLITYPMPKQSLLFQRDYYIVDEDGNVAVRGTSQWCVLNFVTRKIQRASFDFEGEFYDRKAFDDGFAKLRVSNEEESGNYVITESDLDGNMHTNNCRYADFLNVYTEGTKYKEFEIVFQKETLLGDKITFFKECDEKGVTVTGRLSSGETVFTARLS